MLSTFNSQTTVESTNLDFSVIPPWRQWIVQWDISHNAIPLAFFAFTSMWQISSKRFGDVVIPEQIWYTLYAISCTILLISATLYIIRALLFPPALVADFNHPRLVNFFFMPVIIGALCVLTAPPVFRSVLLFRVSFYCLASYQVLLTLYLYGEWLFGAQPTNFIHPLVFMQTIGFFLVANIGAIARLEDQARAMFSVGCLFWLLVFITNFQHVAIALDRRKERPQPTFFLFIAPPAQAAAAVVVMDLAESQAQSGLLDTATPGEWPELAQGFLFVDLFLYLLIFRLFPTFWTSTFAVTWWAYIFPMSAAAGSVIWRYRSESILFYGILGIILGLIACIAMLVVSIATTWAFLTQRLPRNLASRKAYYTYYVSTRPYTNEEDRREEYTNNEII